MDGAIQREKLDQAVGILHEQDVDCWLTFVRETVETPDPVQKLIIGQDVTWQSAFLVARDGRRIAIVGGRGGGLTRPVGLFSDVRTSDHSAPPPLPPPLPE